MAEKSRKFYTLQFKLKIIEEVESGKQKKDICKKFDIAPSTLSTFLKNKKQLLAAKESQKFHSKRKKLRRPVYDDLDQARAMGTPISGPLIKPNNKIQTILHMVCILLFGFGYNKILL